MSAEKTFLEFFAGGGMARLGLGSSWRCLLANDLDPQKCASYRANFGGADLIEGDIAKIDISDLRERLSISSGDRSPVRICRSQAHAAGICSAVTNLVNEVFTSV
ncbi:DNA cytosine methyltransferase [Hyphococcus sp.]|uniref:DNA cytosine methyltransferase n=1 Tax=Hyphococcus sp. TaxID=2038636 RepID=UPI003D0EAADB